MRFAFRELPGERRVLARPAIPVQVEDLEEAPLLCLLDTGAVDNRLPAELAEAAGIPMDEPLDEDQIVIGGTRTSGRCVRVSLTVDAFRFEAPVWFCDPWPFAFGFLGQEGFLRFFRVTIRAAENWLELEPEVK